MHKEEYLTFEQAKQLVRKKGIATSTEYKELYSRGKLPGLPSNPERFYGREKRKINNNYIIYYKKARKLARSLKLNKIQEYLDLGAKGKLPEGLPKRPEHYYKDFVSWTDFIGSKNVVKKGYSREGKKLWSYEESKKHLQKLGITSERHFRRAKKEGLVSLQVPKSPVEYYAKEWKTWEKFLGKNNRNGTYATYEECKAWARKNKIKTRRDWEKKHPKNMPRHLKAVYKKEWIDMNHFLDNKNNKHMAKGFVWIDYKKLKEMVTKNQITRIDDYRKWAKTNKIDNIPAQPDKVYSKQWKGWSDFLGTKPLSYKEAKEFVQKLGLKNSVEWQKYVKSGKKPPNIPNYPQSFYGGKRKK